MARVVITAPADQDAADILADITREAGHHAAARYSARFETLYDRLADHPMSCHGRPQLGASIRVGVVPPYLVIYRYNETNDTASIIRILHRRRRLIPRLLRP